MGQLSTAVPDSVHKAVLDSEVAVTALGAADELPLKYGGLNALRRMWPERFETEWRRRA